MSYWSVVWKSKPLGSFPLYINRSERCYPLLRNALTQVKCTEPFEAVDHNFDSGTLALEDRISSVDLFKCQVASGIDSRGK